MTVMSSTHRQAIEEFRDWLEHSLRGDPRFADVTRDDRADGSTLATRWTTAADARVMIEVAVRPLIPQVRVAIVTDDRWKSEDFEEKIQESGDTMSEFVELGFEECGLAWSEPPVEHYREQTKYFYFATPLELGAVDELSRDAVRRKIRAMIDGYYRAFEPHLAG